MSKLIGQDRAEALIGFLVVLIAIWFTIAAWQRTGGGKAENEIRVTALFPSVAGVNTGTEVRIAGMKVGRVAAQKLDPKSYQAELTLALDPKVKVPMDSSAAITSEGLMGSTYIALIPGGDPTPLKNGDAILDTQGSVDLMSLVGQFINKSGGSGSSDNASAADSADSSAGKAK